jgi:hypothetical protein
VTQIYLAVDDWCGGGFEESIDQADPNKGCHIAVVEDDFK